MAHKEYVIPERYGAVYVRGADGKEKEHKGGQVALMDEKQARAIGAVLVEPKEKAKP